MHELTEGMWDTIYPQKCWHEGGNRWWNLSHINPKLYLIQAKIALFGHKHDQIYPYIHRHNCVLHLLLHNPWNCHDRLSPHVMYSQSRPMADLCWKNYNIIFPPKKLMIPSRTDVSNNHSKKIRSNKGKINAQSWHHLSNEVTPHIHNYSPLQLLELPPFPSLSYHPPALVLDALHVCVFPTVGVIKSRYHIRDWFFDDMLSRLSLLTIPTEHAYGITRRRNGLH